MLQTQRQLIAQVFIGERREPALHGIGNRDEVGPDSLDRKSTRLNSSHDQISYAVFCLKKKKKINAPRCLSATSLANKHTALNMSIRPLHPCKSTLLRCSPVCYVAKLRAYSPRHGLACQPTSRPRVWRGSSGVLKIRAVSEALSRRPAYSRSI